MTKENAVILSAPANSGYRAEFETTSGARDQAAILLGISADEMIEIESANDGITYCYASQSDADADRDGAYAVQYEVR